MWPVMWIDTIAKTGVVRYRGICIFIAEKFNLDQCNLYMILLLVKCVIKRLEHNGHIIFRISIDMFGYIFRCFF